MLNICYSWYNLKTDSSDDNSTHQLKNVWQEWREIEWEKERKIVIKSVAPAEEGVFSVTVTAGDHILHSISQPFSIETLQDKQVSKHAQTGT